MLKLVNITKDYKIGGGNVINALRGLTLEFRQNEFVSVLGPSGCGKTTLLNIIGGLDHSTSGDLLIYNKSTREYEDRDWDVYRNHRIGFVFQNYNLIPHQTVLGNVELSLTIAGLSKVERVERAKKALDKVGLSDQYNKRPNQLSGGQSQRVAIARALVNDPEILLADEPTGALDTVTSKQIMELVKEISKERLVIMVTHNSEIAEFYSTRIIRLLDGNLLSDTNPFNEADSRKETALIDEKEKAIKAEYEAIKAAILEKEAQKKELKEAASAGKKNKKTAAIKAQNKEPEKEAEATDKKTEKAEKKSAVKKIAKDKKIEKKASAALKKTHRQERAKMSFWTAFKLSLKNLFSKKARTIMTSIAGSIGIIGVSLVLAISYGVQNYIDKMQNDMLSGNPIEISETAFDINAFMDNMSSSDREELKKGIKEGYINIDAFVENLLKRGQNMQNMTIQNNINKNYVNFVQDIKEEYLSALFLDYGLDVSNSIYTGFVGGDTVKHNISLTGIKAIYSSILKIIPEYEDYVSMIDTVSQAFKQAPDADDYILSQYNVLDGRIAKEASELMVVLGSDRALNDLLLAQLGYYSQEEFLNVANKAAGNSYNKPIKEEISFKDLTDKKFMWYKNDDIFTPNYSEPDKINPDYPFTYNAYDKRNEGLELKIVGILEPKEDNSFGTLSTGFYYTTALAEHIIDKNKDSVIVNFLQKSGKPFNSTASSAGTNHRGIIFEYQYIYGDDGAEKTAKGLVGSSNMMLAMAGSFLPPQFSYLFEGESKTISLQQMGGNIEDLKNGNYFALPSTIAIYPKDLDYKALVLKHLDRWNSDETFKVDNVDLTPEDREEMKYTDNLSIIMSMIKEMVQIVTIALIGFTSLALVVSCVMIAIITYVSVVERIKEIGVIRSLGGRKRDVSNLFTAETVIIGLASGLIGILITYILSFVINLIVQKYAQIAAIAIFPFHYAVIMVAVSVGLTLISGLMPSRAAAKKDPVVALRTE